MISDLYFLKKTKSEIVGSFLYILCVQRSWTTLAGESPVTVIASEPCS